MSALSIGCIIVGMLYMLCRFPLAVAPRKSERFYRFLFASNTHTRIFVMAWLIPWCVVRYASLHSTKAMSNITLVWSSIGIVIALYVIVFAANYRRVSNEKLDVVSSDHWIGDPWPLRIFCLLTGFAGVFLLYLGIQVL